MKNTLLGFGNLQKWILLAELSLSSENDEESGAEIRFVSSIRIGSGSYKYWSPEGK